MLCGLVAHARSFASMSETERSPSGAGGSGDAADARVRLLLLGDVMTGRGIDQIQRHPGHPRLYEGFVKSALEYVAIAEQANGPIPRSVDPTYVWGDVLA